MKRRTQLHFGVLIALVLVFFPSTASAQDAPETGAEDEAAAPEDPADAEARALFEAGRASFEAGLYDNALESFERAAEVQPDRAELHYNVGLCAERLRRDERAATAYRRFLELEPSSPQAAQVRARLRILDDASQEAATTVQPVQPAPADNTLPIAMFAVAGAGVVGAALSAVWLVNRLDALDPCYQPGMACEHVTAVETERNAAIGVLIGSATIAVAALVLGLVTWDGGDADEMAWTCHPGRGCALRF